MKKKPLASGRWQVDHTRQVIVDGRRVIKRYRESFDTSRDADLRLLELKRLRLTGESAAPNETDIAYCFRRWREYIETSDNHSPSYRERVDFAWLQLSRGLPLTVKSLKPAALDSYIAARRKKVAPATVLKEFRVLSACLNWCESRGMCFNPIRRYAPPRIQRRAPPIAAPDVLQSIFNHLRSDDARKAVWFILATGLRFSEFAGLTVKSLLPGNQMRVIGKGTHGTPRERYVPMPPSLPFDLPPAGLLFTLEGRRWNGRALLSNIHAACHAAEATRINIHHLRHCAATYKLAGGMNVYEIMQQFGWRSFGIVQQYVDISHTVKDGNYLPKWKPDAHK